ncbi:putative serine carboxypeptidase CPVL-like protein, partial [Leptotrombidium deliense]
MKSNDVYITGQSYGCKFITGLAYKIHNEKKPGIKLKGLAIGGAFCDPPTHIDHGENLYQFGLIDEKQKQYFDKQRDEIRKLMNAKNYNNAYWKWNSLINGVINETKHSTYFYKSTGLEQFLSIVWSDEPQELHYFETWLSLTKNREIIHTGNISYIVFNQK